MTKQIFWEENVRKTKRPKRLQKFQRLILHIRHDFAMPENHLSLQIFMGRSCAVVQVTNDILSILSLKFPPSILENSLPGGCWAAFISEIMLSSTNVISEDSAC